MIPIKKVPTYRRPTAKDVNVLTDRVNSLTKINTHSGINSFVSPLGVNILQSQAGKGVTIRIFEVKSEATGDGLYTCWRQKIDATFWANEDGTDYFDDYDNTNVTILNLLENNPAAAYMPGLVVGDRMTCWQMPDDEGDLRWVGVPIVASTRRAKIQTGGVGASALTVKLLNAAGAEVGAAITVYPIEHLGSNDLSGDVWPDLSDDDIISVFQDINGNYYTTFVFDDSTTCV